MQRREIITESDANENATAADTPDDTSPEQHAHHATVYQTVLNLAKTCMGTGTLALPFAASQGGVVLYSFGMVLIMLWNLYSIQRLIDCLRLLPKKKGTEFRIRDDEEEDGKTGAVVLAESTALLKSTTTTAVSRPPRNTSTLGQVAWYALGPNGLYALDIMFVVLLCGIIVAYEDAMLSFLKDTPLHTTKSLNAVLTCVVMGLLSVVPHMGHLARVSGAGLLVLLLTFILISYYAGSITMHNVPRALPLFPHDSFTGVSHWFGCVVFGYGTVPLTYNIRESMRKPELMVWPASTLALLIVAFCYLLIGVGLLLLYPDITGDVLSELPTSGWLPTTVRLSMTVVVLVTAPLLIVPCGELLESKLFASQQRSDDESITHTMTKSTWPKLITRLGICGVCTLIAVCVPSFVYVLSFVGSCCVALVSFVVPALLHLVLEWIQENKKTTMRTYLTLIFDAAMLLWGATATLITSVYTFRQMISQSSE